jgi:putative transposase
MARPLRIEYPGAMYHITSRGIDRRDIFNCDKDREHLIQLLKEGADFFKVDVIAYCLMPNHVHFLLRTTKANLSRFMQRLNVAYTRYFNYKYKRVGPLLQGRYKAILVGSDEYFMVLSRYIHLNPVKVKDVAEKCIHEQKYILGSYKWSSYAGVLDPKKRSRYFKCEHVLEYVGGDTKEGRDKYEKYVLEGLNHILPHAMNDLKFQFLLGSEEFVERIKKIFLKGKDLKPFDPEIRKIKQPSITEIACKVASVYGTNADEIINARSKHKESRKVLIELSYRFCLDTKTLKDLGKELGGISGAGVARVHERFQEELKNNKDLNKRVSGLVEIICQ